MAKSETLLGTGEDDTLTGNDGGDILNGGYGDDQLDGGAGNDVLDGDRGSDVLRGGAGDDTLISDSDAGEPVVAQDYDPNEGRNGEIDPATNRLYPNQPFVADDVLIGGEGADTFVLKPQLNAKEDIIQKHTDADGRINWANVAGENNNVHDHWVDSIGTDVIADYDKAEGDRILLYGHTADANIRYEDVDGDGDEESIIEIYSNQGNGGGAHNGDFLGQAIVHGDRVEESDLEISAMETYGVVETIDELQEAINPTGTSDTDIRSVQSENPNIADVETRNPGENAGPAFVENVEPVAIVDAPDDTLTGTDGNDTLEGDPMTPLTASLENPISYWTLSDAVNGTLADATGTSDARYYIQDNGQASLQLDVPTIEGRDGGTATLFGEADNSFAYVSHDSAYEVLNGTVTAWINPQDLGGRQTIIAKDERNADGGGHFHMSVDGEGRLFIRVAEGEGRNDGGYNHEWRSKESVITEGNWQHVALSFGAAGVTAFVDGQALADDDFDTLGGAGNVSMSEFVGGYAIGNDKPFIIGANTRVSNDTSTAEALGLDQSLGQFFEGGIADVGFWGGATPAAALSADQVAELYANGPGDVSQLSAPVEPPVPVGDDTISGAAGDDTIDGGAGNDTLDGGDGSDTIQGGYGDDIVTGGAGNDTLDGGHGEDTLSGGDGDDVIVSRADAREPVIAQDYDASDDPDNEIDPATNMLYPSQANMPADDVLSGGAGADDFRFETLINGKEDIINRHVNDDRTIDWMGVAGENNNVHDHWVDGIGNDTITDFNRDEGDRITIEGHTTEVSSVEIRDVDGDGDNDSVLQLRSNQGNGGGAHNLDLLGTITVLDTEITDADYSVNAGVAYGIVDTIDEYKEAVTPLMRSDDPVPASPEQPEEPPVAEEPEQPEEPPVAEDPEEPEQPVETPVAEDPEEPEQPEEPPVAENPEEPEQPEEPPVAEDPEAPAPEMPPEIAALVDELLTPTADNPAADAPSVNADLLIGTGASEDLMGSWGDDRIAGDAGDDTLSGGHGDDLLSGGDGDDLLSGDFGDDILIGGVGQDEIRGNRGEDVLVGGESDDVLDGGAGDDVLYGGAGEDAIDGGRGLDVLVLDGTAADYTFAASDMGLIIANAAGETDLANDVEHIHLAGSGETFAIQADGTLAVAENPDEIADLLEGDLLAEVLNLSNAPGAETPSVDEALSELAEMAASEAPAAGQPAAALPVNGVSPEIDTGISTPGEDDMRVA